MILEAIKAGPPAQIAAPVRVGLSDEPLSVGSLETPFTLRVEETTTRFLVKTDLLVT